MNIKKRLFYSNLLMVVIPLVTTIIIGGILYAILNEDHSGTEEVRKMNESLLQIENIIDNTDAASIPDNIKTQNTLMEQLSVKGFHVYALQDGKVLFTTMDQDEESMLTEYINQQNLYTANQTLWIPDDDVFLLLREIETNTTPITLITLGFNDVDRLSDEDTAAIISISFLVLSAIVFTVIFFSLFLANRILKKIMVPLDHLCEGAQRIREGNLDQDILCQGVEELEKVCDTFNEMQHQLKENEIRNEKYERERNEMLAGISHDLRTPLTSIKSYVKGLQDDIAKTPDKQKEYLNIVYRKTCRIEELINSLFLFSKLETGKFPFDFKIVSIQNFIVTLLDLLEYDLKKNNAVLSLKSTCTNQKVYIDGVQMTRAITNILDNSVKYNTDKSIHIIVTLTEQNDRILICIQDDGVGVSQEQLPRLFDSFYRGDESRNTALEGSGLGLAIAKNIVTANNGIIYAKNDNGLIVIIELPVVKEEN